MNIQESIEYVDNRIEEMREIAINQYDPDLQQESLEHVKNPTEKMCLIAVKQCGSNLQYIKHQTPEICFEAVMRDGEALQYVRHQTLEVCMAAVGQACYMLHYIDKEFYDGSLFFLCKSSKIDRTLVEYIRNQRPIHRPSKTPVYDFIKEILMICAFIPLLIIMIAGVVLLTFLAGVPGYVFIEWWCS